MGKFVLPIVPLVFVAIYFLKAGVPLVFPLVGGTFMLVIGGFLIADRLNKRELRITRSHILIKDRLPQGQQENRVDKLPLGQIENILLQSRNGQGRQIIIIGKEGVIPLGPGLSKNAILWLQNFLRSAVVTA